MQIAVKTLLAIEEAFQLDQGSRYRGLLKELMPLCGDAYSTKKEEFRDHLGASILGRECVREVWYSFRWTTLKKFEGRILRLFNRGHLEEGRMIALLKMIDCEVWQLDENGKQFRIDGHMGHFGGSLDAVVRGIPDLPVGEPCLSEFKTHNAASFAKLIESGVMATKWEHFVQCQLYMGKQGLRWALYMATNKDTDAIHAELVQFDPTQYQRYLDRSVSVIEATSPPPKINTSPGWYKCRFCDHRGVCHGKDLPARNCRTCISSRVGKEGKWFCDNKERQLTLLFPATNPDGEDFSLTPERQRTGCKHYTVNETFKSKL